MHLRCTQENLAKGLSIASKAVSTKATLPILGNFLFSAKDGVLKISSSNLEVSISVSVNASVEREGEFAVPAKVFADYVGSLPVGTVELEFTKNLMKVGSGSCKAEFNCSSSEDFPATPLPKDGKSFEIGTKEFSQAISNTSFCAAVGDSRPVLTGVFLKNTKEGLKVVATDGFRLSEYEIKHTEGSITDDFSLLIPARSLSELSRLLPSLEDVVKVMFSTSENLVVFECGQVIVSLRLLDGDFPDYQKIVPTQFTLKAKVNSEELVYAVKLTNVFAKESKDGNNLLKMEFTDSNECLISSYSEQSGNSLSRIKMEIESEKAMVLSFNSKYLLDFFNNVKVSDLLIATNGEQSPCLFRPIGSENFLHLIMPVKLNS